MMQILPLCDVLHTHSPVQTQQNPDIAIFTAAIETVGLRLRLAEKGFRTRSEEEQLQALLSAAGVSGPVKIQRIAAQIRGSAPNPKNTGV